MITFDVLRSMLFNMLGDKIQQGFDTEGLYEELKGIPDSYDKLMKFGEKLSCLPLRGDWPFVEPNDLETILSECDPARPKETVGKIDIADSKKRVYTAFCGSVCGCILGKPLEEYPHPTLYEIKSALENAGEWPLCDYIPETMLDELGRRNPSWVDTTRGRINSVATDDDITYTIIGMVLLEKYGLNFSKDNIRAEWVGHLPIYETWGPERTILLKSGLSFLGPKDEFDMDDWVSMFNPGDELCGALIRADAYGYACPGRPELAVWLAWRDASWTHRRTGIYGAMFVAAAIACAQVMKDPLEIFNTAIRFVPQKSRFYRIASDSLNEVAAAKDWLDGYDRIHNKYEEYTACRVYQEVGTLINTLRFAENIGDGICKQVCQGNDTDSFGATAGSILGAYFGPGYLEQRWLEPFNDDLYTTISGFKERKLSKVAERMSRLPEIVARELSEE